MESQNVDVAGRWSIDNGDQARVRQLAPPCAQRHQLWRNKRIYCFPAFSAATASRTTACAASADLTRSCAVNQSCSARSARNAVSITALFTTPLGAMS